jgi:hypothetical protein
VLKQGAMTSPVVTLALATSVQRFQMQPLHLLKELVQAVVVAAHSVVVVITTELGIEQLELFSHPAMAILLTPLGYAFD